MNQISAIQREVKVLQTLRSSFNTPEYVLAEIVQAFGKDLRDSVELGFPDDVIAWDLFSRWQEIKEGRGRAA